MSASTIRGAISTLTRLGVNPRNFRDAHALVHAAKIATAQYRAKIGV